MTTVDVKELDAILAHLRRDDAPGAVVSVQQHGRVLLRQGYGMANLEAGNANAPVTKMRIGSTTKHFACVLALLLRDDGRLDIDAPVSTWLPELPPSQGARTLRQFMTHTGGTRDYLDLSLISNGMSVVPAGGAFDYQCRQEGENFRAGEQFIYNNGGYRMLSLVIERVTEMPLAQAMRERLFEPLAMHDTSLWTSDLEPLQGVAQAHVARPEGGFHKGLFPAVILGEGGIASTLDDMQRWLSHLGAPWLWPQRLSDEMMAGTPLTNGHVSPYGMGLVAESWRGVRIVHHAGGVVGGSCQMLAAPEHGVQIIVMTNRSDLAANELADKLLVALIGDSLQPLAAPASADLVETWGGDYYCEDNGRHFAIARQADTLLLKSFGMPLPLVQADGDRLRVNLLSVIVFGVAPVRDAKGRVVAIDVSEQGRTYRCDRIEPGNASADSLSAFAGQWDSAELAARVTIDPAQQDMMRVSGRYGSNAYKLEPLRADACLLVSADPTLPLGGTLRIRGSATGVRELVLDTSRTRAMRLVEAAARV